MNDVHDNRDYADLRDETIAVYNFRGYTVLKFDKKTKTLSIGKNHELCSFVTGDLILMSDFLKECHEYTRGELADVKSMEVD